MHRIYKTSFGDAIWIWRDAPEFSQRFEGIFADGGAEARSTMTHEEDLGALARSIIDSNRYLTLGTADASGLPWVSPVWYAPADYREFFWVSSPDARHSRNLALRPQLAIVTNRSRRSPSSATRASSRTSDCHARSLELALSERTDGKPQPGAVRSPSAH